jgi:hypothetical protein
MSMPILSRLHLKAFTVAIAAIGIALAALVAAPAAEAQEFGEGPMSLFITYQCKPENRSAFRAHMAGPGVEQFERWKQSGAFTDYLILFSSYVNSGETAQDMVVRLDFDRYSQSANWKTIEQTMPSGLSAEALRLCTPQTSYLADLEFQGQPSPRRNLANSVYLWIPYHLAAGVGKPAYREYFQTYVRPQNEGWLADGALSWWGTYFNQHNTGRPWDMLFLYEYSDITGLARRNVVKEAVRLVLRNDPVWKQVSDNKQSVRHEDQVIIMDPILPRSRR